MLEPAVGTTDEPVELGAREGGSGAELTVEDAADCLVPEEPDATDPP